MLGTRMEQEGGRALTSEARLCYVCSGSVERLVECWEKCPRASSPMALQVPRLCRALVPHPRPLGGASSGDCRDIRGESSE